MEKTKQAEGVMNYRVNGDMRSFKTVDELFELLENKVRILNEPLTVEPIKADGQDYDHMQEILDLTYQAIPCIKGLQAMAGHIQLSGKFLEYDISDINQLALRCRELLDEIMDIAEASEHVYESEWKAAAAKAAAAR
jgi:hypothetical protein